MDFGHSTPAPDNVGKHVEQATAEPGFCRRRQASRISLIIANSKTTAQVSNGRSGLEVNRKTGPDPRTSRLQSRPSLTIYALSL